MRSSDYLAILQADMDKRAFNSLIVSLVGAPIEVSPTGFKYTLEEAQALSTTLSSLWGELSPEDQANTACQHMSSHLETINLNIEQAGPSELISFDHALREVEKLILAASSLHRLKEKNGIELPSRIIHAFLTHDHGKGEGIQRAFVEALHTLSPEQLAPIGNEKLIAFKSKITGDMDHDMGLLSKEEHDEIHSWVLSIQSLVGEDHIFRHLSQAIPDVGIGRVIQSQMSKQELTPAMQLMSKWMNASSLEAEYSESDRAQIKAFVLHFFPKNERNTEFVNHLEEANLLPTLALGVLDFLSQANAPAMNKAGTPYNMASYERPFMATAFEGFHYIFGAILDAKAQGRPPVADDFYKSVVKYCGLTDELLDSITADNMELISTALTSLRLPTTNASRPNIPEIVQNLNSLFTRSPELKACFNRDVTDGGYNVGYFPEAIAYIVAIHRGDMNEDHGFANANDIMAHEKFSEALMDINTLETVLRTVQDRIDDVISSKPDHQATNVVELMGVTRTDEDTLAAVQKHRASVLARASASESSAASDSASASGLAGGGAMPLAAALKDAVPASSASDLAGVGAMPPAKEQADPSEEESTAKKPTLGGE